MKPMVPHTGRAPHPWDVGGEPQEVFGGRQRHQAGGDAHGHPATGVASADPKEGRPARPIQWPEPWSRHSLELFPTPKRSAKAKGKGRGRGKGKGRHPGGSAAGSTNAEDYIYGNKVEIQQVKCHFCQQTNIEGTHKCQSCFKWLIAWWENRYGGMPDGNRGQENQQSVLFGQNRFRETAP